MQKKSGAALIGLLGGFIGAWIFVAVFLPQQTPHAHENEAFERVMRTQTIRCGYAAAPPLFIIDPSTRALSGIGHDIIEAVGKALSLKIEWAEEVGWATFPVALASGRIDMFCTGAWPSAALRVKSRKRSLFLFKPIMPMPV